MNMKQRIKNFLQKEYIRAVQCISFRRYDPRHHAVRKLHVAPSALRCFSLSANNIKYVCTENGVEYFREIICRSPLPEYLQALLDDYFFLLYNERELDNFAQALPIEIQFPVELKRAFEAYVRACRQQPGFYGKLGRLEEVVRRSGYSMWRPETRLTEEMLAACGFTACPEPLMRVFPDFFAFMKSGLEQYRRSALAGTGGMDSFNACRTVATKIVAEALGLGKLIPDTEVVQLCAGEKRMYGVLCSRCPGMRAKDALWAPSPTLQKDLADLQVLDAICYQKDHAPNNYNVYAVAGRAAGAMAFDNDNLWTFFPFLHISFTSAAGGSPLLGRSGLLQLPHLSAETARRVLECDAGALCRQLELYLNPLQRVALKCRIRAMQRALRRTMAARADFLLADDAWTEETLQHELSGACGHTYTYLYATRQPCACGSVSARAEE